MADLDGVVRIGTEIDDSGFKKGMQDLGKTAESNLSSTKKEFKDVEKQADDLGDALKDTAKDADKFSDGLKDAGKQTNNFANEMKKAGNETSTFGNFLKANLVAGGISAFISGIGSAVQESEEFTKALTRLETNAKSVGADFGGIQENFKDFIALTGQADSSAEALSNLLQTGFDDAGITQAVEALSGAVVKFPDTLNIESLADGLQETLATGAATGQFAELLDRLGIGAESFSSQLAGVTTEAERQQLVLETLSSAGLNDLYEQYAEANSATLEFNEAQAELNMAMSNFVQGTLPLVAGGLGILSENALRLSEAFKTGGLSGLLSEAQNIALEFANKIVENAPQLLNAGFTIINNIISGVLQNQATFFQKAPELVQKFTQFLTQNLPTILQKGKEIILNLALGIINNIPTMIAALPQIIRSITGFIADNLPIILKTGLDILWAIIKGIIGAIPDLVANLPEIISAIVEGLIGLLGSIVDVGKDIVEGLWEGITNAKDWLFKKIEEWCDGILEEVKAFFGIESPSKVMRDQVGKMLVEGAVIGVNSLAKKLTNSIVAPVTAAKKEIRNAGLAKDLSYTLNQAKEKALLEAKNYTEIGDILTNEIQNGIENNKQNSIDALQTLLNDSVEAMQEGEQKEQARQAAQEIVDSYTQTIEEASNNAKQLVGDKISQITNEFQTQYDDLINRQQQLEENLGGTYLFEIEDGEVFIEDVQKSIDTLNEYGDAIEQLKEKGASGAVLDELARLSPEEGLQVANELLGMTDEDFELLNEKWAEKQELAKQVAADFYADQLDTLKTEFSDKLMDELNTVPDDVYNIGLDSVDGWIKGLNQKLPDLENKARELARAAIDSMKSELGIASPSKEGIYIGEMMNAGVAKGLDNSSKEVEMSISKMGFFDTVKSMIPQIQSAVYSSMAAMTPAVAFAGTGGRTETIQTINRNTTQTVQIVADGAGIFDIVQKEGKRRGSNFSKGGAIVV